MKDIEKLFSLVKRYFNQLLRMYPSDNVDDYNIYFLSGYEGTRFDWEVNHRLPYFIIFSKDNRPYISVTIQDDMHMYASIDFSSMYSEDNIFHRICNENIDLGKVVDLFDKIETSSNPKYDLTLDEYSIIFEGFKND